MEILTYKEFAAINEAKKEESKKKLPTDLTRNEGGKQSIAALLEPIISKMHPMSTDELKKEVLDILKSKETHASESARNKWINDISKVDNKGRLMSMVSNIYLAGANMKVK